MKKTTIRKTCVSLVIVTFSIFTHSQIKEIGAFTAGGVDDATELMAAYITPWANALGTSLSGGWYNTAKVHKPLGFDLTFTINMGFVPSSDKTFDLDDLDLQNLTYTENIAQTAAGKKEAGPELSYDIGAVTLASFNTPKGTGVGFIPTPMAQLGLGLVKGTEVNVRLMPNINLGNSGKVKLWGLGLKHDILQWIPGMSKLPVLNASLQGGLTKFNLSNSISFLPGDIGLNDLTTTIDFADQSMNLEVKSFTMNLLVSANLPVVCFYGGVGFAKTTTTLSLDGYFPVPDPAEIITPAVTETSAAEVPSVKIKNNDGKATKPRLNIGMRIKMGVITIHGDYTKANYSNVTAGIGISFR